MIYQIQDIGGEKTPVPVSGTVATDSVTKDDMHPVTSNAVAESKSYSTTETLTGGTWIDGKPIYRKAGIYNNNGSIGTGTVVLDSTLTRSYIGTIIATGGMALSPSNNKLSIGGYSGDANRLNIGATDNGLVKLSSSDTFTNFRWWIEYTKN